MKRIFRLVSGCLLVVALMLSITAPAPVKAEPKGKVIMVHPVQTFEMKGADWHTGFGSHAMTFKNTIADGLTHKNSKNQMLPALAESWKIAAGWSKIDIFLRKGVKFNNGMPVTAEDVKFSLERMMRKDIAHVFAGEMRRSVESIEAIGDDTIILHLKAPYPAFLTRCSEYFGIAPKAYIEKVGDEGFAKMSLGAGPFKLVKFEENIRWEAEAVADHYRHPPEIKTFVELIVPEDSTRLAMLKTGEADIAHIRGVLIQGVKDDPNLKLVMNRHTYLQTICFYDLEKPEVPSPWHDRRVRLALDYAIDRETICNVIGFGQCVPWAGCLAPYHAGYDPNLKPVPYNPEMAKKLLAEAGYPNGFETNLVHEPLYAEEWDAIAGYLGEVGIKVNQKVLESSARREMIFSRTGKGIGYHSGPWWAGRDHPGVALDSYFAKGSPWAYSATQELLDAVRKCQAAVGQEAIAKTAQEIQRIYLEQRPLYSYTSRSVPWGLGPRIAYWEPVMGWPYPSLFEFIRLKK